MWLYKGGNPTGEKYAGECANVELQPTTESQSKHQLVIWDEWDWDRNVLFKCCLMNAQIRYTHPPYIKVAQLAKSMI